jgi:hypothetical protein
LTFSMIVIFYTNQSVDFFNRQSLTFLFAKNSLPSASPEHPLFWGLAFSCRFCYTCPIFTVSGFLSVHSTA